MKPVLSSKKSFTLMKSSSLTLEASMIPSGEDLTGPFRGFHTYSVSDQSPVSL